MIRPLLGPCDSFRRHPEIAEHFWKKVAVLDDGSCWLWGGAVSSTGYGSVWLKGRICGAHRVAAYLAGIVKSPVWEPSVTERKLVLHTCDVPLCCNPKHLYAGNFADNSRDKVARGRSNNVRGMAHYCSRLTEEQVADIRKLYRVSRPSYASVGRQYGVASNAVRKIVLGISYAHLI